MHIGKRSKPWAPKPSNFTRSGRRSKNSEEDWKGTVSEGGRKASACSLPETKLRKSFKEEEQSAESMLLTGHVRWRLRSDHWIEQQGDRWSWRSEVVLVQWLKRKSTCSTFNRGQGKNWRQWMQTTFSGSCDWKSGAEEWRGGRRKQGVHPWSRELVFKMREITQVTMLLQWSSRTKMVRQDRELLELHPFVRGRGISVQVEGLDLHETTVSLWQ